MMQQQKGRNLKKKESNCSLVTEGGIHKAAKETSVNKKCGDNIPHQQGLVHQF
jgi:hypothetical protein